MAFERLQFTKIFTLKYSLNQHMHAHTAGGIIFQSSDRHQIKIFAFHEPVACLLLHDTTIKIGHFIRRDRKCGQQNR